MRKGDSLFQVAGYDSAIYFYKQACFSNNINNNWNIVVTCNMQIAQCFQVKGKFDSAFFYLRKSEVASRKVENFNSNLKSTYYYLLGSTYGKIAAYDSAVYYLKKSSDLFLSGVSDSLQVLVMRSLGNINYSLGKYNEALQLYKDALYKEGKRGGSSEKTIAALFQNIGIIYSTYGEYDSAQTYLNKSLELKEKFLQKNDPQLALGYLNYGYFLNIIGYPNDALNYLTKAEDIYISVFGIDYFGLAPLYLNKGAIYISQRDLNKALIFHERAKDLYKNGHQDNSSMISDINMNIGVIYENKTDYKKAIYYYKESLKENISSESQIKSLRSLAKCYQYNNDYKNAEIYFQLSIEESEKLFGFDHHLTAGSYLTYGDYCASLKNYEKAKEYLFKAYQIRLNKFGMKNREVSIVLSRIGDLYNNLSQYGKSIEYYQDAIIAISRNFNNKNKNANPQINDLSPEFNNFALLYKKAYALYDYYTKNSSDINDLISSFETGKLAIELFESILASYQDDETKMLINDYIYDIYNLVVLNATDLYNYYGDVKYLISAFEYTEKSKSAILLSSLRALEATEIGKIPIAVREKETELKKELSLLNTLISDENQKNQPDSLKISTWKKRIFKRNLAYDSLLISIEKKYPEYYNLKYKIGVISPNEIETNLKSNEMLIEYKLIDSLLIIFSIDHNGINVKKNILDAEFNTEIHSFILSINQFPAESYRKEDFVEFIYKANDFCQTLLNPVFQSNNIEKIIIIPDNILGYLPFEVLINNYRVPNMIDFKNLDYIIKSYSISYSYSSTLLYQNFTQNKIKPKLLAVAPDYGNFSFGNGHESFAGERNIVDNLKPLTYSLEEVNNIVSLVSGTVLSGSDATEANFKKEAGNFGILHLAMHTLINDEDPLASKLVFTLANDTTEDGFLNAYEVYNLKLNAALAVLSACNTGAGKFSKGEGIMSIARGFIYAGVPSVIMTLWEVEDVSGSEIMNYFYSNLRKGQEISNSIRNAKLAYLESSDPLQSHPYFWAAFVQIGKTNPVLNHNGTKIIIGSLLLIFITIPALYFGIKYLKKKRNNKIY